MALGYFRGYTFNNLVTFGNENLPLYTEHLNHSPCGFSWGYSGSGPSQLAFAMLYHVVKNVKLCLALHQQFKIDFVSRLNQNEDWELSSTYIKRWIMEQLHNPEAAEQHKKGAAEINEIFFKYRETHDGWWNLPKKLKD